MRKMIYSFLFILSLTALEAQVDYESQIQTIFNNNCTSCHIYGHTSGLNLTMYSGTMTGGNSGSTIVAGDHANSELYNRITLPETANGDMPPTGSLSQSDIDLLLSGSMKVLWRFLLLTVKIYFSVNTLKALVITKFFRFTTPLEQRLI